MSSIRISSLLAALVCALTSCVSQAQTSTFSSPRLVVETRGAGPDVVLVPGLTSHPSVWDAVIDQLGGNIRIHVIHVRGFAGLEPEANATGPVVAPVADEVARYIRTAGLDRPVLVGHSMGGTIAMMIAARHPDLPGPVLSVDAPPFIGVAFGGDSSEAVRPAAEQIRQAVSSTPSGTPGDPLESMAADMTRNDSRRHELVTHARRSHRPTAAQAFYDVIVTDLRPELPRITAPLTMLFAVPAGWPGTDEQFEAALRASFAGAPHARLVRVDDSGHAIHVDQPATVAAVIRDWLTQ